MKTQNILSLALCLLALVLACQPEEVAPLQSRFGRPIDDKILNPSSTSIPPDEVIRTDYSGATKWRITFNNPNMFTPHTMNYQCFFSTETGDTYSLSDLNTSAEATAQADLNFLYGSLDAIGEYDSYLQYPEAARDTEFVPAELSQWDLAVMTVYHPDQFQDAFENSPLWPTFYQPYNYNEDGYEPPSYQKGEIYLFKIDQSPARYGAVRIVERANIIEGINQYIIEITVQSNNNIIHLKN
ncbi:MAG: hypothetical protein AAF632_02965 [Bacteroidota bacterium]